MGDAEAAKPPSKGELEGSATAAPVRAPAHAWRYRAAVLALFAAFNLVTFNRYFPLSEGWWETYGYLWNSGLRPYRDFELAFTPLFTMVNAGLLRVFGDSFFALRLFGVGVFLLAVLVVELLLERFFSARMAAAAVTVSTFLAVAGPQFIAKDYHWYELGMVALALLVHVRVAEGRLAPRTRLAGTFVVGVTAALVFLLKQNVGALLVVAIAASLPLVARERRIARVAAFCAGVAVPIVLVLPVISIGDWGRLLLANDAKGSVGTVLFRFLHYQNGEAIGRAALLCAGAVAIRWGFAPPAAWRGVLSPGLDRILRHRNARRAAFLVLVALVAANGNPIRRFVVDWAIPATLAFLAFTAYRVGRGIAGGAPDAAPRWKAITIPLLALAYANTTTAAFDFIGMHVPVALAMGWLLATVERRAAPRWAFVAALALLVVVPELAAAKLRVPYQWWVNWQGSVAAATAESAYPQLRGIRMIPEQRDAVDAVKHEIEAYSRSRSDVLFFSLPIFYWLHHKLPPDRAVVQWFDVASSREVQEELRLLQERPPRLVIALEPTEQAYVVHRRLKQTRRLPQEDFRDLMDASVASGRYLLVRSIALPSRKRGGNDLTVQDVLVQNASVQGAELDALLAGTDVVAVEPVPVSVPESDGAGAVAARTPIRTPARPGMRLALGEVVTLVGEYGRVRALSERLGVARGRPRDWNTVNVYVRADAAGDAPAAAPTVR